MASNSVHLSAMLTIPFRAEYIIVIPVFNVKSGWDALKVATSKVVGVRADLIACIKHRRDFICVFSSKLKPETKFPVYKSSSGRAD